MGFQPHLSKVHLHTLIFLFKKIFAYDYLKFYLKFTLLHYKQRVSFEIQATQSRLPVVVCYSMQITVLEI